MKKITKFNKVDIPTYEPRKFMYHYDNGNSMLVTYYPKHNSNNNLITLQVWDKNKVKQFHKNIKTHDFPEIVNLPKDNDDFISSEFVLKCIHSCENNICSLDFNNLNKDIVDYGCINGWPDGFDATLIKQYNKDIDSKHWLCVYLYEISLGFCLTETVNYTYGYKFNCDSSD